MAHSAKYVVQFRRKREGRTDYGKRLKLLKSKTSRLIVRKTNKYIIAQIANYDAKGDKVLITFSSKILEKKGWSFSFKSVPAAYLLGLIVGKEAKEKSCDHAILDIGLHNSTKGSRIYAVVKGCIDAGLNIPVDESMFPDANRINGKHINDDVAKAFDDLRKKLI